MITAAFGIVGFALLFIMYVFCLFGKISQESKLFNAVNVIGALMIAYYSYKVDRWFITMLPLLWALISLYYLVFHKINHKRK